MSETYFAQTVRQLRAQAGVGREVVAARADVSVNTVRNAELGHNTKVDNLRRVLNGLGYDLKVVRLPRGKHASRLKATHD